MTDTQQNHPYIIDVTTSSFMKEVIEASNDKPIIVDFWAPWCSPCKQLGPILEKEVIANEGKLILAKINIDENQAIAGQLQIQSIPTVYVFHEGQPVDGFQGNIPESEVKKFIDKTLKFVKPDKNLETKLSMLQNSLDNEMWENVITEGKAVLDLDNENILAISSIVKSLIKLEKFDEAEKFYDELSEKIKTLDEIKKLNNLIQVSKKSHETVSDLDALKKRNKENPSDLKVNLELSSALFGSGQIKDSYDLLLYSIKIDPNWNDNAARKQLLQFIDTNGINSVEAKNARRQLSSILFN